MADEYKRLTALTKRVGKAVSSRFLQDFLPADCAGCDQPVSTSESTQGLCLPCATQLALLHIDWRERCERCAEPRPCRACQQAPWPIQRTIAAFSYQGQVREMLLQLKFGARREIARALAPALARQLSQRNNAVERPKPVALIAMPIGQNRLADRGFNQSWELMLALNAALTDHHCARLPARQWLQRRDTSEQARIHLSGLPRAERARQVQHVFRADEAVAGHRIYLLDDVMTTGATMRAAGQVLLDKGAHEVIALVVARA